MQLISLSRAWLRKTKRINQSGSLTFSGPKMEIPFQIKDEPIETRSGFKVKDKSPFYEMDPAKLYGYYFGYQDSMEFAECLLYTDITSLKAAELNAISENSIHVEDINLIIQPVGYTVPNRLQDHSQAAIEFFKKTGKINYDKEKKEWENNTSLRIRSIKKDGMILCEKAKYFTQVATNITLDWATGKLLDGVHTIRSGIERPKKGRLPDLEKSVLANTLGVAVMFFDTKLNPIIRVRSDDLASIQEKGLHCTASGVFEVPDGQEPGCFDFSLLTRGMANEIYREVNLKEHEYILFPVAFARELPRGGKPQLFFAAISLVSHEKLRQAALSAIEAYEYVGEIEPFKLKLDNYSQFREKKFTYEGWACLHYANQFVEANEDAIRRVIGKNA